MLRLELGLGFLQGGIDLPSLYVPGSCLWASQYDNVKEAECVSWNDIRLSTYCCSSEKMLQIELFQKVVFYIGVLFIIYFMWFLLCLS